jgi:hypothetical protein
MRYAAAERFDEHDLLRSRRRREANENVDVGGDARSCATDGYVSRSTLFAGANNGDEPDRGRNAKPV